MLMKLCVPGRVGQRVAMRKRELRSLTVPRQQDFYSRGFRNLDLFHLFAKPFQRIVITFTFLYYSTISLSILITCVFSQFERFSAVLGK